MASLSGNKIKDTYQSLIKLTDNGNLTTGAKQLTDGFGNNSPLYISTTQIGIGVTPEATYDLHVYQNAKVGGNLTITGDLTVNGTTTTVDTDTLRVEDPLIEVARNNTSSDAVDIGIYGKYAPSGTTLYAGLFRDTGDDKFKLFKSLEEQPTTTVNTSGTGYTKAGLVIGDLESTAGIFSGDVSIPQTNKIRFDGSSGHTYISETADSNLKFFVAGIEQINITNNLLDINSPIAMNSNNISGGAIFTATTFSGQLDGTISSTTTAVTQSDGDNSTKVATTAYVDTAIQGHDTLAEVLVGGNTTGGTDIAVSSGDDITFTDSSIARFGTDNDFDIYHNGTNAFIKNATGTLYITNTGTDQDIWLQSDDGSGGETPYVKIDGSSGAVELNHYGTKKFETTSSGVSVTGNADLSGEVQVGTAGSLFAENVLRFYSAGTGYFDHNTVGQSFIFRTSASSSLDTTALTIASDANATFAGDVIVPEYIKHSGDEDTSIRFTTNNIKFYTANNEVLELEDDGQVNIISAGTVTNPCLTIGDDVNTGIWRPASDTFAISTGGNERMRIDSGGSVMIGDVGTSGTPAVDYRSLEIGRQGNTITGAPWKSNLYLTCNATVTGGSTAFTYRYASEAPVRMDLEDGNIRFYNAAAGTVGSTISWSERMRIDSSGNVGIGTSSPSRELDIQASSGWAELALRGNTGAGGSLEFWTTTTKRAEIFADTEDIVFRNTASNTERMRIDSSGNLSLATATSLDFNVADFAQIKFKESGAITIDSDNNQSSRNFQFKDGDGSSLMFIGDDGNVGIGVTSPAAKLHVSGDTGGADSIVRLQNTNSTAKSTRIQLLDSAGTVGDALIAYDHSNADSQYHYLGMGVNNSTTLVVNNNDNVGIGTTSPRNDANFVTLQVGSTATAASQIVLDDNDSNGPWRIISNQSLIINDDATERMRIDSSGNLLVSKTAANNATVGNQFMTDGSVNSTVDGDTVARFNRLGTDGEIIRFQHDTSTDGAINSSSGRIAIGSSSTGIFFDSIRDVVTPHNMSTNTYSSTISLGRSAIPFKDLYLSGSAVFVDGASYSSAASIRQQSNALIFSGGSTGYYFNKSDNSATHMFINSSGNVGIGTTNPQNKFVIKEGSNVDMEFGSEADGCFIQTYNRTTSSWGYLRFIAGGGERMRITRVGGEVLINQTSDLTGQIFQVNGMIDQTDVTKALRVYNGSTFLGGIGSGQWAISATYANDYALYAQNNLLFHAGTGSSIDMMIDANHNVGIATTSPSAKLHVNGVITANDTIQVQGDDSGFVCKNAAGTVIGTIGAVSSSTTNIGMFTVRNNGNNRIVLHANGSSYFNGGNVGIGTTSPSAPLTVHGQQKWYTTSADGNELRGFFNPGGSGDDAELSLYIADGATEGIVWRAAGNSYIRIDSTSLKFINFYYGSSNVGQIVTGGTNVLYQSNSDYRLKENVVEMTGALDRVEQLKPSTYNFISQPETQVDGFMAHELQEVVPQAVSGEKDEMNEDGTPKYQGVDHSQIVPLLVGAIKELKAEIETLKAQINN